MNEIQTLHDAAMELADQAFLARLQSAPEKAVDLMRRAFEKEREAANRVSMDYSLEPTRSVLHRSAAALALQVNEARQAEKLIAAGLSGEPPEEIAEELRSLLEQAHFQRHLSLRGLVLAPNEFQFSLMGAAVGPGIAESEEFVGRVQSVEKLVYRTAERKAGRRFREAGRRDSKLKKEIKLYVSMPRAASFAVSFKIGERTQPNLPGMGFGAEIVDDLFECLGLFGSSRTENLRGKIPDEGYYRNFIGLARTLAPDGVAIRAVGFTAVRGGQEVHVALSTPRAESPVATSAAGPETRKRIHVRGTLKFADAMKEEGLLKLVATNGVQHKIKVPCGMMSDIVRPLWDYEVEVVGFDTPRWIVMEDIHKCGG